jgi:uncharacterized glyoxalase superfamily protein PhnB
MADLIGQVVLFAPSEGGRHLPAYSGFRPQARLPGGPCPFALRFMCDDSLRPGESDAAMIDVGTPEECRDIPVGHAFDLLENARVIGRVTILENLWTERQKRTRSATLNSIVPWLGVADVEASVAFYHGIGFEVLHEHRGNGGRDWVQLKCGNVNITLKCHKAANGAARPVDRGSFCLYCTCEDVAALHHFLAEQGYTPTPIQNTFYGMQEFEVTDPDGYRILFAHPSPDSNAG